MNSKRSMRGAFTLIEVMVAVMIISVVIAALIQMYANNTHIYNSLKPQAAINQYASFFISNPKYGLERSRTDLATLVDDYDLKSDLRRELKEKKIEIGYKELDRIRFDESDDEEVEENLDIPNIALEVGETNLKFNDSSLSLVRFRIQ